MDEQDEKAGSREGSSGARKLQKSYFDVLGLCCSSEVPLIESILKQLDGVKDVSVIVASRTVIVVHDSLIVSQSQIVNALNQARLEANVKMRGEGSHKQRWPSPYAMASGGLLLLSFLKYVYRPMGWVALGAVAVGIIPIALRAMAAIRNLRLEINVLALIAVSGTIAMRDYLEAGTIVFLFSIAEWLQSMASHKARAAMSSLMSIAPQKATIAETGEEVDVDEVKLNTMLAVKAGEVIPIDGIVVDGKSEVDEKTLTGESFPVPKEKDSSVWAGTINLNGYINVRTTALAEDCVVAKMAKLVEDAQNKKSKTQRLVDKFAQFYTPAIVVVFLGFLVLPMALRARNRDYWVHLSLVVLVSGCPCALVLSTPVATFCALTKAARSGLLIKGGDYLETLAKIKAVAFDKTGTITRGEFVVAEFKTLSTEISRDTILYWVSSIESKSSHPLAAAVVQFGRSSGIVPKPEDVEDFQNFPGEGIYGRIDRKDFFIGNKKIAAKAGSQIVPSLEGDSAMAGKTVGYIFLGAELVGVFSLSDECRTGASEAIRELKSRNIRTIMLTGDSQAAATNTQNQLGNALDLVYAELLPEDKSKIIQQLQAARRTAMVGDGINDAPALATSDVGISMGVSGSALATETGHVILMSNDIRKIPKAIDLARKARRKVFENVTLSFLTRMAILALAFAGHPLIWAAVLADTGTCLLVIMNSMLLLRGGHRHRHVGKCSKKPCGPPKEHNHKKCCDEKKRGSLVLPPVHTHRHCGSTTTVLNECCESTNCSSKQKSPMRQVSCESRNCRPNCHSSQSIAGSDEIIEIPNPSWKQECCSTSSGDIHNRARCDAKHSSSDGVPSSCLGNRYSNSPTADINHIVSGHKGSTDLCCLGNSGLAKGFDVTHCATDDLELAHKGHHDQTECGDKHRTECGSHDGCAGSGHQYTETATAGQVCCSSETRGLRRCCRSYMAECCATNNHAGHLGRHPFGSCLTEIVIE